LYSDLNFPLVTEAEVPGLTFSLEFRQGEENGFVKSWEAFPERGGSYGAQAVRIDLHELMSTPTRSKTFDLRFPGRDAANPNLAIATVTVHVPAGDPLDKRPLPPEVSVHGEAIDES
jgi:hypothetical protein